ncbi:MAG: HNH endonuclease [Colwellia sp.]|nr:HNH endonuclease [Colwellia sp.]
MRTNFSKATKVGALKRCGGKCEVHRLDSSCCGDIPDSCENIAKELDHIFPDALGGDVSLENSAYLCRECHFQKTRSDRKYMARRNKHVVNRDRPDKKGPKQKMVSRPFNKAFKKKFDGTVERRMK